MINFVGGGFQTRAGYFAHGACEKYLKAVSVQAGQTYLQTHRLADLVKGVAGVDPYFSLPSTLETLRLFDAFEQVGRYGGASNYDPLARSSGPVITTGVSVWGGHCLAALDAFVGKTRGLLDFKKANYVDAFAAILAGDKSHMTATWTGRPPLRVVLTKQNQAFPR
jgi:hypothetical protein